MTRGRLSLAAVSRSATTVIGTEDAIEREDRPSAEQRSSHGQSSPSSHSHRPQLDGRTCPYRHVDGFPLVSGGISVFPCREPSSCIPVVRDSCVESGVWCDV